MLRSVCLFSSSRRLCYWTTACLLACSFRFALGSSSFSSEIPCRLSAATKKCLDYFDARGIKLVVRLNNKLYDKQHFLDRGIRHEELYFDDGTNPTDEIVRKFINLSDEVVESELERGVSIWEGCWE